MTGIRQVCIEVVNQNKWWQIHKDQVNQPSTAIKCKVSMLQKWRHLYNIIHLQTFLQSILSHKVMPTKCVRVCFCGQLQRLPVMRDAVCSFWGSFCPVCCHVSQHTQLPTPLVCRRHKQERDTVGSSLLRHIHIFLFVSPCVIRQRNQEIGGWQCSSCTAGALECYT